jgi:DNA invertase Pin-like site-specific DNA recombinase
VDRLIKHWQAEDFDVLVCRELERLGRTQTMIALMVEQTIAVGARVYSLADGWIDNSNQRGIIAISGYKAASDIDRLVKGRKKAMAERARRGLPTGPAAILSHRIVRDEYGKAIKMVVDESKQTLIRDAAVLLLQGVSWSAIERELYERYGHVDKNGKPYAHLRFYGLFNHPAFWGHSAQHFRDYRYPNGSKTDMWTFDASYPVPEGVIIHRNTHEPALSGKLAHMVQEELRRRRLVDRRRGDEGDGAAAGREDHLRRVRRDVVALGDDRDGPGEARG